MMRRKILLVEDNIADAELVRIAVEELGYENEVVVTNGSEEVFNFLEKNRIGEIGLILLDLNMPKINGIEVLKKIRSTPRFKHIPVVVFTTSSNRNDILTCYEIGANAYVYKPIDYEAFNEIIKATIAFWIENNLIPIDPDR